MGFVVHNFKEFVSVVAIALMAMFMTTLISLIMVKILWDSTIPYILPGFVEQGLIAESISLWTATKLSILVAVMGGRFIKFGSNRSKNETS